LHWEIAVSLELDAQRILQELEVNNRLRRPRLIEARRGAEVFVSGRWLTNVSSNDYLGLADHALIRQAGIDALGRIGGSSASRLVVGNHVEHAELERSLRTWLGFAGVCLFNSGVAANTGVMSALTGPGDLLLSDELNHASIIDGCRLSRAETQVFKHGDIEDLELRMRAASGRRLFVVTESLFSMDGDVADIAAIAALCRRFGASLIVDEAHALGIYGPCGRGICAATGVIPDVLIGTFGKALGVYGAFAASTDSVAKLLWNRARSLIFTTGLPPAVVAMCSAAIEVVASDVGQSHRAQLLRHIARSVELLADVSQGVHIASQIVPLICGSDSAALDAAARCEEAGFLALAIRPPTVAKNTARIRICLRSDLTEEQLDRLLGLLVTLRSDYTAQ
jgi:8-amino-7-oxononanoate synthase